MPADNNFRAEWQQSSHLIIPLLILVFYSLHTKLNSPLLQSETATKNISAYIRIRRLQIKVF